MLKLAEYKDFERIKAFCFGDPFGAYICCRAEAYGFSCEQSMIWISENISRELTCIVSSLNGNAVVLASDGADFEELSSMLFAFNFKSVLTSLSTAEKCSLKTAKIKKIFRFKENEEIFETVDNTDMKSVYSLLCASFSDSYIAGREEYLTWLSDFIYRKNRNLARLKAVETSNVALAVAMTAAEWEKGAVVSSVACNESCRGKGLGKAVVVSLASELKKEKKDVFVIAQNRNAEEFYNHIGFENCGMAAYIERQ